MFATQHLPYHRTHSFSTLVTDYLDGSPQLQPFFIHPPTTEGLRQAIENRKQFATDRNTLVEVLNEQYRSLQLTDAQKRNLGLLLSDNTFTITTAHQPNLFTGPLYFIYKILHAIKLAEKAKAGLPGYEFVPVFYMGSEDADLQELNHIYVQGKKYEWQTSQQGAVGRMRIDKQLTGLIKELAGQVGVQPFGNDFIDLLKACYKEGNTIQQATFELLHHLFGHYGLLVLVADDARLKRQMLPAFADDLFHQKPSTIVNKTCAALDKHYHVQANPRDINLFYLKDNVRQRIEKKEEGFVVVNTNLAFSEEQLRRELEEHPDRFSPNVILRGLYQETILPNIAFIGGGGELAYWLQLKHLFQTYNVPFPTLLLRNSFLVVENRWKQKLEKLGFQLQELFDSEETLMKRLVEKNSAHQVSLNGNLEKSEAFYQQLQQQAAEVDSSLAIHVTTLQKKAVHLLKELEKKMLRAEKRKFGDQQRQISSLKEGIFPGGGLQERKENFGWFYSKWGSGFIEALYQSSLALEQQFTILSDEVK